MLGRRWKAAGLERSRVISTKSRETKKWRLEIIEDPRSAASAASAPHGGNHQLSPVLGSDDACPAPSRSSERSSSADSRRISDTAGAVVADSERETTAVATAASELHNAACAVAAPLPSALQGSDRSSRRRLSAAAQSGSVLDTATADEEESALAAAAAVLQELTEDELRLLQQDDDDEATAVLQQQQHQGETSAAQDSENALQPSSGGAAAAKHEEQQQRPKKRRRFAWMDSDDESITASSSNEDEDERGVLSDAAAASNAAPTENAASDAAGASAPPRNCLFSSAAVPSSSTPTAEGAVQQRSSDSSSSSVELFSADSLTAVAPEAPNYSGGGRSSPCASASAGATPSTSESAGDVLLSSAAKAEASARPAVSDVVPAKVFAADLRALGLQCFPGLIEREDLCECIQKELCCVVISNLPFDASLAEIETWILSLSKTSFTVKSVLPARLVLAGANTAAPPEPPPAVVCAGWTRHQHQQELRMHQRQLQQDAACWGDNLHNKTATSATTAAVGEHTGRVYVEVGSYGETREALKVLTGKQMRGRLVKCGLAFAINGRFCAVQSVTHLKFLRQHVLQQLMGGSWQARTAKLSARAPGTGGGKSLAGAAHRIDGGCNWAA